MKEFIFIGVLFLLAMGIPFYFHGYVHVLIILVMIFLSVKLIGKEVNKI